MNYTQPGEPDLGSSADEIGPLELLAAPSRRWRAVVLIVLASGLLAAGLSLVLPERYEVSASFVADPGRSVDVSGGLANLAGRFGLGDLQIGPSSPQFYADLLRSRAVLRRVLRARVPTLTDTLPVIDVLRVREGDSLRLIEVGERALSQRIVVRVNRITSRVDLSVSMPYAPSAQAVADTLLDLLDEYNREIRRSRAGEKRAFAVAQASMAAESLRGSERAMEIFLERNRSFQQSAQLQFQHERLARTIALRQDIYLALARQAEEARIEEVDTRPIITIVDPPVRPGRRSWPRRKVFVLGASMISLALAWSVLVMIELVAAARLDGGTDLGRALRLVRQSFRKRS
jgi:uncharacterized protein involved in exopolysaccharide biosynthesis